MTLESITAETAVLKKPVVSDSEKLLPEVLQLVRTMPGGVAGILKQFQDRGLGHVALALTSRDGTRMVSPQQIVHGLGTQHIDPEVAGPRGIGDDQDVRDRNVGVEGLHGHGGPFRSGLAVGHTIANRSRTVSISSPNTSPRAAHIRMKKPMCASRQ